MTASKPFLLLKDGYVTEYTYNSLDLVSHINYNDAKEVTYQYNKVGELVKMDDWLGTTTFEVDLLGQLKKVTDHKGKVVSYAYDAVGNQTSVTYPDETTVTKTYDAVYNLTKVTDAESQNYTYVYDDAGRVTKLTYPNGWVEDYTYDAEGNLLKTVDTDPFHNNKKSTKYEYRYDAEGNLVSEYKRDTTASNRALTTTYTYDGLNRVISAHEEAVGHNTTRTYLYDTLGNLIREEQDGCVEYKYNGFALDESKKCGTIPNSIGTSYWEYTYDGRGNLVSNDKYTRTTSGMAWQNEETYVYDETNHMVDAKNEQGEHSLYTYNGLGLRVGRELIMQDNTHGYTDFHDETPSVETGLNKPEVAVESYVIDYTSPTFRTLTMEEEGGFDYRWVYGLDKLSVKITSEGTNWWGQNVKQDILKDYLHQDRLGSTTNLTDKFGRVVGRADYNEWGEITYKDALDITSAYRRIYPQLNYTGHDWDDVLEMYYAKARFYDPDAKRFVEIDPVKGNVTDSLSLVSYLYCVDNPLRWVDPLGLYSLFEGIVAHIEITAYITSFYPSVKAGVTLYGLTRTKSGRGYADIIQQTGSGTDIYEIKSEHYRPWWGGRYAPKGIAQLESYIEAINNHPELNPGYSNAKKGTLILSDATEASPIILPYIPNKQKVIAVYTDYEKSPGMIFYEIRKMKKKDEEVLVSEEAFITEDDRDSILFYNEEYVCPGLPDWNYTFMDIDTHLDYEMNADVIDWLNDATIEKVKKGWGNYACLSYPDGTTFYRYLGLGPAWLYPVTKPSTYGLFKMYNERDGQMALDDKGNQWTSSPTPDFDITSIPVVPIEFPVMVPAF